MIPWIVSATLAAAMVALAFMSLFPPFVLASFSFVLIFLSFSEKTKIFIPYLALAGISVTAFLIVQQFTAPSYDFFGIFKVDSFSLVFDAIFLGVAGLVVLNSLHVYKSSLTYYVSILLAVSGMMSVAHSIDFISLFIGLELMSVGFYPLILYNKDKNGTEAATKFFIVSIFSAGALLFGISFMYGATGSSSFYAISLDKLTPLTILALTFITAGFAFKIGAFPFNLWVPDVYEGAPANVTALLASASKKAGFAALFKFFLLSLPLLQFYWTWVFVALAILTMSIGNIVALAQKNVKRLVAYSTIGQVGYILIAMAVPTSMGIAAGLLQMVTHAVAVAGVLFIISILETKGIFNIDDYDGLGMKYPLLGFGMLVFFASLAGIPPLAGFFSKFYLFSAAVSGGFWWLAGLAVIYAVVSMYFYFRVLRRMFVDEPKNSVSISFNSALVILLSILFIAGFSLFADNIFKILVSVAQSIV